ncbi:hypothetical protein [Anaerosporobacter faecicola]|uniref:hypothetical protein n=1 Tax=Anaerosporobacter faecicola TaxID=2718714 RepID=UPI00143912CD|nr:hypothetical protein [Anaerosporobacter faecicola]
MNVEIIQKEIDRTDYWDMEILDLKSLYFGDEIEMIIDNDDDTCWKIVFLSCFRVSYETDASWRKTSNVKNMKKAQLGYYGQDMVVSESEESDFYKVDMDLSIMTICIECKNVLVEKISKESLNLFWKSN